MIAVRFQRKTDNKLRGALGETDFKKGVIKINKKRAKKQGPGEVLKTIVHEEEHVLHPKKTEKHVERDMKRKVKRMHPALKKAYYDHYRNK